MIPDADVITFSFGIPYHHLFGHRGFFHSPFFGLFMSLLIVCFLFRERDIFSRPGCFYLIFFFLPSASHGILDAFTNGGSGIALLSPLDKTRYFSPWRPIMVSPIGVASFFSQRGLAVIKSELLWVWIPFLLNRSYPCGNTNGDPKGLTFHQPISLLKGLARLRRPGI